jgi:hypothetical protein
MFSNVAFRTLGRGHFSSRHIIYKFFSGKIFFFIQIFATNPVLQVCTKKKKSAQFGYFESVSKKLAAILHRKIWVPLYSTMPYSSYNFFPDEQ